MILRISEITTNVMGDLDVTPGLGMGVTLWKLAVNGKAFPTGKWFYFLNIRLKGQRNWENMSSSFLSLAQLVGWI